MEIKSFLRQFILNEKKPNSRKNSRKPRTRVAYTKPPQYPRFVNEFWTSRQRQSCSLHEVAYRACFKPQLPRFFIELLSEKDDTVFDPFAGRGTTIIEAALLGRKVIGNDINPLSRILTLARLNVPNLDEVAERLNVIRPSKMANSVRLSMFYSEKTLKEIIGLRDYLQNRRESGQEDRVDLWIRMIATNRLSGHSPGFFSVYTLPPNQAVSRDSQLKINKKRKQKPSYRNTHDLILKKSKSLLAGLTDSDKINLATAAADARFYIKDARQINQIPNNSIQLTVTSPPFLDVVQYQDDNWLRWWFNNISPEELRSSMTTPRTIAEWSKVMLEVLIELCRITRRGGWVAFEVGEVKSGQLALDEYVLPLGMIAGFRCKGILVNKQRFTKTAHIWGIQNNAKGTNSNRVVIFRKE